MSNDTEKKGPGGPTRSNPNGAGRKLSLTPEKQKRAADAIALGSTYEIAASYAGIGLRTFYTWMARGQRGEQPYEQFWQAIKKAESRGAIQSLSKVITAAQDGNWQAAAWLLERRHGYTRNPEVVPVSIQIDAEQVSVSALIEELRTPMDELKALDGPVIDVEEE